MTLRWILALGLALLISSDPASARGAGLHGRGGVYVAQTAPMGWNSWYGLAQNINEATLKTVADTLKSTGLVAAGYTLFMIDGGWWDGGRDGNGNPVAPTAQWPDGMLNLTTYIRGDGLVPTIYTDAGSNGCISTPAGQGSYNHYQQDINTFNSWGFGGVKVDSCGAHALGLNPVTSFGTISPLIPSSWKYWNICDFCNWVPGPNTGLAQCTSGTPPGAPNSTSPTWEFGPYLAPTFRISYDVGVGPPCPSGVCVTWARVLQQFDQSSLHPGSAFPGHYSDPDYLAIGLAPLIDTEGQSQISLWALATAPLIIGNDPRNLTAAELTLLKNAAVIAVDQDSLSSQAVLAATPVANTQVWSKRLNIPGTRAVGFLNRDTVAHDITVTAAQLGLTGTFSATDLWAGTSVGSGLSSYTATAVASHATVLLKVVGTDNPPATTQINAGGAAVTPFIADTSNGVDGTTATTATTIALTGVTNPAPMAVYQSARVGVAATPPPNNSAIEYFVPNLVIGGSYKVRLHFAEITKTAAGQRQFNVRINNSLVLQNFDIYATAGAANQANVQEFTVAAPQGSVSVHLSVGAADFPLISGIEVIQQ